MRLKTGALPCLREPTADADREMNKLDLNTRVNSALAFENAGILRLRCIPFLPFESSCSRRNCFRREFFSGVSGCKQAADHATGNGGV